MESARSCESETPERGCRTRAGRYRSRACRSRSRCAAPMGARPPLTHGPAIVVRSGGGKDGARPVPRRCHPASPPADARHGSPAAPHPLPGDVDFDDVDVRLGIGGRLVGCHAQSRLELVDPQPDEGAPRTALPRRAPPQKASMTLRCPARVRRPRCPPYPTCEWPAVAPAMVELASGAASGGAWWRPGAANCFRMTTFGRVRAHDRIADLERVARPHERILWRGTFTSRKT